MFGLEGCGFVLSISVTFLLIGLVVYLFKKQLKTLEQKFAAIFQLSQTLATSVETLRQNYDGGSNKPNSPPNTSDTRPAVILSDSDTESDSDSECSDDNVCCPFPNVKIVDIENEPLKEHMLQVFNFNNTDMNKILDVTDLLAEENVVEDVGVGSKEEATMSVEDDTEDDDTEDDDTDGEEDDAEPGSPNYKGMKVPDLRKLVQDKKIETDKTISSLKKQELINLLKKTN
jgi:hypothetical protein